MGRGLRESLAVDSADMFLSDTQSGPRADNVAVCKVLWFRRTINPVSRSPFDQEQDR